MHIVFLNIADTQGALTGSTVKAIRKKYPAYNGWNLRRYYFQNNTIEEFDLIPLYEKWVTGKMDLEFLGRIIQIQVSCDLADKVMLGVHGNVGDTDNAYIADFGKPSRKVSCVNLVRFFLWCLPNRGERFHMALIMCFGARAQAHLTDHSAALSEVNIKSSFAYKFYKLLCVNRSVLMTGRTGSVSFDRNTGHSLVQTEDAVGAEAELRELQAALETKQSKEDYERLWKLHGSADLASQEDAIKVELGRGRTDWSMASGVQLILIRYNKVHAKVQELSQIKDENRTKHGKIVYLYDPATQAVTVNRKYPRNEVIYSGPL
jgi:hypothetical protein